MALKVTSILAVLAVMLQVTIGPYTQLLVCSVTCVFKHISAISLHVNEETLEKENDS